MKGELNMPKDENNARGGLFNFRGMRIDKRLKKAFNIISVIAAVGTFIGLIAIIVVCFTTR